MQNDQVHQPTGLFGGRRSTTRLGVRQANRSPTATGFNEKSPLLDYNYYCSPSNYLAECLRKRLSSKFLERFQANRSAAEGLRSVIEDLSQFNSALGSSSNTASTVRAFRRVQLALDRTFYNNGFLSPLMSNCISAYRKNCAQVTQQTLFQ